MNLIFSRPPAFALSCICCLICALVCWAFYELLSVVILREPYHHTSTSFLKRLGNKNEQFDLWQEHPFHDVVKAVSKLVYMQPYEETRLDSSLYRLGINYSAREYKARGICMLGVGLLLMVISLIINFPIGSILGLLLGIALYFHNQDTVKKKLEHRSAEIYQELPQFVQSVKVNLAAGNDLISTLRRYLKISGSGLREDLEILLTELNTGNAQIALQHFDRRVNMPEVSRLASILINAERGEDQSSALAYLATDITLTSRERIRRELALRPGRMHRAMIPCILLSICSLLYVLLAMSITSLKVLG